MFIWILLPVCNTNSSTVVFVYHRKCVKIRLYIFFLKQIFDWLVAWWNMLNTWTILTVMWPCVGLSDTIMRTRLCLKTLTSFSSGLLELFSLPAIMLVSPEPWLSFGKFSPSNTCLKWTACLWKRWWKKRKDKVLHQYIKTSKSTEIYVFTIKIVWSCEFDWLTILHISQSKKGTSHFN